MEPSSVWSSCAHVSFAHHSSEGGELYGLNKYVRLFLPSWGAPGPAAFDANDREAFLAPNWVMH
jgi:hypothetical protein